MMKSCVLAPLCAAMMGAMAVDASANTLLRWTEGSGDRGPRAESFRWFAETVTERTGKEVEFQFYFGGALMGHAANVSGIGGRAADIGQIIASYTPRELLPYSIGDMPLVDADPWVGLHAMYEFATTDETLQKMFDDLNLVYISNLTTGPVQVICKGKNIGELADFNGVKVRASGLYGQALADLGANVISLSQEDVYSALDTGLVECNQQYVQGVIPYRQHEVSDQIVMLNWGQILGFGVVMNKDAFEELTEEQQEIVRETGREFLDRYGQVMMRDVVAAQTALRDTSADYHLEVVELSESDVARLAEVSQTHIDKWVADTTAAGYPAQEMLDRFIELTEKYRAKLAEQGGYPWE